LSLPAELRIRIYSHLLLVPNAIDVSRVGNKNPTLTVALLRVSKQIHAETSHYLYSANTFTLLEPCDRKHTSPPSHHHPPAPSNQKKTTQ
jgi:hypothetical protein